MGWNLSCYILVRLSGDQHTRSSGTERCAGRHIAGVSDHNYTASAVLLVTAGGPYCCAKELRLGQNIIKAYIWAVGNTKLNFFTPPEQGSMEL